MSTEVYSQNKTVLLSLMKQMIATASRDKNRKKTIEKRKSLKLNNASQ